MKDKIWVNCPITLTDARIGHIYSDSNNIHTGVDISHSGYVFSLCDGVVLSVNTSFNMKGISVVIQYSTSTCIRYSNLIKCYVKSGQLISRSDRVGSCLNLVHFEYITNHSTDPFSQCIRIGSITYFRSDPQQIISGSTVLSDSILKNIHVVPDDYLLSNDVTFTSDMEDEFDVNNRGGIDVDI